MNRFMLSVFYSFISTLWATSLYYTAGVVFTLATGGDVIEFFRQTVLGACGAFVFLFFVFYAINGHIEEMNKERRDTNSNNGDKSSPQALTKKKSAKPNKRTDSDSTPPTVS